MTWVSLRWLKTYLYMAYTLDSVHKVKRKRGRNENKLEEVTLKRLKMDVHHLLDGSHLILFSTK